jgi:hypothetical protein
MKLVKGNISVTDNLFLIKSPNASTNGTLLRFVRLFTTFL